MKRIFTVHRGGRDREASVTQQHTVRSRAAEHRRFNTAMSETMKELFPEHKQPENVLHLMTPVRSWGDEVREGLRQKVEQNASQEPQDGDTEAFDSPTASLSPAIRRRLAAL